jgi:hypothetical protein
MGVCKGEAWLPAVPILVPPLGGNWGLLKTQPALARPLSSHSKRYKKEDNGTCGYTAKTRLLIDRLKVRFLPRPPFYPFIINNFHNDSLVRKGKAYTVKCGK